MPNFVRVMARILREKVGWNRAGFFLSVTIMVIAAGALTRMLQDIDIDDLIEALQAIEAHQILLAALFVAAGYLTLTFYDLFALRTIGRNDVPYRVAALAAFTSYSIGHNVGASVFTGGAVRYRIYSQLGLNAVDVAKVCFVAGLTFWLGNATVLGAGIAWVPQAAGAIDHRRPRGTVIDHQAVLAFIHFQQRHAGELAVIAKSNEPSAYESRIAGRKSQGHDLLFRYKRLVPDRGAPRSGNGALQFDDRQLLHRPCRQAPDARGDDLAAILVDDLQRLPSLRRELHRRGDVFGGDDRRRRQEPARASDADQARICLTLRVIEVPHDADGHVRELRGIDAGGMNGLSICKQNERNKQPPTVAPMHVQ